MTKDFFECAKNGGKVVSKKTKDGRIIKICYDKEGNSHVKRKFNNNNNKKKKWPRRNQKRIASKESLKKLAARFNDSNLT